MRRTVGRDGDAPFLERPGFHVRRRVLQHVPTTDAQLITEAEGAYRGYLDPERVLVHNLGPMRPDDGRLVGPQASSDDLQAARQLCGHSGVEVLGHEHGHFARREHLPATTASHEQGQGDAAAEDFQQTGSRQPVQVSLEARHVASVPSKATYPRTGPWAQATAVRVDAYGSARIGPPTHISTLWSSRPRSRSGPRGLKGIWVHLSAAMIPPQSALDELAALVRSVGGDELQFEAIPADWMQLPVTGPEWQMTHLSVLRRTWVKSGVVARPFEVIDEVVFEG